MKIFQRNFDKFADLVQKNPTMLEECTEKLLKTAKQQHSFETQVVLSLVSNLHKQQPPSLRNLLQFNCLRMIMTANFHVLSQNQLYSIICLIYAQKLEYLKQCFNINSIIYGYVLNEIFLKFLERSKHIVPEYIAWLLMTIDYLKQRINHKKKQVQPLQDNTNKISYILKLLTNDSNDAHTINIIEIVLIQLTRFLNLSKKKQFLALDQIKYIATQLKQKIPANKANKVIEILESMSMKESQPVYLEQPEQFKQLTPRMIIEEQSMKIKLLKRKRNKLKKRIQSDLRNNLRNRLQEKKIIQDVKNEKINKQRKKQMFIIQKQTVQVKKYNNEMKRVKKIRKSLKTKK